MSCGNSFIPRTLLSKDTEKRRIHPLQRNILLSSFLSSYDSSTNVTVLSKTDHLISSKLHTKNANHCSNAKTKDQIHNRLPDEKSHNHDNSQLSNSKTKNKVYYQLTNSKKESKNYYQRNKTQRMKNIKKTYNREEEFKKPNQNSNLRSDAKRQYQNNNFRTVAKRQEQQDKKQVGSGNFHTDTTERQYQNNFRIAIAKKQDVFFSNFCTDVKDKNYTSYNNARRQEFQEFKNHFKVFEEYGKIPLYCEICDVKVNEVEPMMEHFNCKKHRKNMNDPRLKNHINFAEYDRRQELFAKILDMRKNNIYGCELCKVVFSTRFKLTFHKKSKDHEEVLLRQSLLLGQNLLGRAYLGQKLA